MAKLYATEREVIDMAAQLFGGVGVASGKAALYPEIQVPCICAGTSGIRQLPFAHEIPKNFPNAN